MRMIPYLIYLILYLKERSNLDPKISGNASEQLIRENLPDGIYREIESVASITPKTIQNGTKNLLINDLSKIQGARIYVRNGSEIWTTGKAS